MEKKFTHIDELFKNKLNNHKVEPPAHLWNNISQELDNAGGIDDVFKKSLQNKEVVPPAYVWDNINASLDKSDNKRKTRIWWMFGSGAAVIAAFIAGYFIADYVQTGSEKQPLAVTQQEQTIAENALQSVKENNTSNAKENNNSLNFSALENENVTNSADKETHHSLNTTGDNHSNTSTAGLKNNSKTAKPGSTQSTQRVTGNNGNTKKSSDTFSGKHAEEGKQVILANDNNNDFKMAEQQSSVNEQSITEAVEPSADKTESIQIDLNNENIKAEVQDATAKTEQTIDLYEGLDPVSSYFPVLSISPFFSPMYVMRNSFNDEDKYDPIAPGSDDRFNHTTRFSYQAGVLLGYNFTRNISIHVGCSYNQITHYTGRGQLQTIPFSQASIYDSALTVQTSAGELTGISVDPNLDNQEVGPTINIEQTLLQSPIQRVVQTIGFVEVPVLFKYRIATSRVGFLFTGGFSTGFIVRNDAFAENQKEYVRFGETANIRNVNFNLVLGAGFDVQITPWMYFTFEPTFRYSMMNWSTKEDVKINPIMFGANTGLSFRF